MQSSKEQIREKYDQFKQNLIDFLVENRRLLQKIKDFSDSQLDKDLKDEFLKYLKRLPETWEDSNPILLEKIQKIKEMFCEEKIQALMDQIKSQGNISSYTQKLKNEYEKINQYSDEDLHSFQNFFSQDHILFDTAFLSLSFIVDRENHQKIIKEQKRQFQETQKKIKGLEERGNKKIEEIDQLTKDATGIGLSNRYTQEKKRYGDSKCKWTGFAIGGLVFLFVVPFIISIPYIVNLLSLSHNFFNILKTAPIYLVVIWFILFASNRRNENNRLEADYAHKAVFASSYLAYQEEIKELQEKNPNKQNELIELNIKLLDSMIGVLSDNPAKSLDSKKSADGLPAKELISLTNEILKLKK